MTPEEVAADIQAGRLSREAGKIVIGKLLAAQKAEPAEAEGFGLGKKVREVMQPYQDEFQGQLNADPLKDTKVHKAFRYAGEAAMNVPQSVAGLVDAPVAMLQNRVNPETGVLNVPGVAWDAVKGLATGLKNIIPGLGSPVKSFHDDPVGTVVMGKLGAKAAGKVAKGAVAVAPAVSQAAVSAAGKIAPEATAGMAKKLMRSATPTTKLETTADINAQVAARLESALPATRAGEAAGKARIGAVGTEHGEWIQSMKGQGKTVPIQKALDEFQAARKPGLATDELAAIDAAEQNFLSRFPNATQIPVDEAANVVTTVRNSLKSKIPPGVGKNPGQAAELNAARAMKQDIYTQEPNLVPVDAEYAALKKVNPKLTEQLRKLEESGTFPTDSLTADIVKEIRHLPSNIVATLVHGGKIISRPDIRSRIALKLWEASGGKGPRPISVPPARPVAGPLTTTPAPTAPPPAPTVSLSVESIPADLEVPITVVRGKTGKKVTVKMNARQAYLDSLADIAKIKAAMGETP